MVLCTKLLGVLIIDRMPSVQRLVTTAVKGDSITTGNKLVWTRYLSGLPKQATFVKTRNLRTETRHSLSFSSDNKGYRSLSLLQVDRRDLLKAARTRFRFSSLGSLSCLSVRLYSNNSIVIESEIIPYKMAIEFKGQIVVYSILGCPHCMKAKNSLRELGLPYTDVRLDLFPHIKAKVMEKSGMRTVPQIYFNETLVGGNDKLNELLADKAKLNDLVEKVKNNGMPEDGPVIPDPSTAVAEADPFSFECEPDEYFLLVNEMRKDNVIRTHRSFLKSQKNAFSGKDFVKWVKEMKDLDESRALEMGQALLDRRFARAQNQSDSFAGGSELYVMVEDDESEALNSGPVSECVPKTANEIGEHLRKMILKLYGVFLSPDGKAVDYKGMKASDEFQTYKKMTKELVRVDIENASREEKLAFFINIYNALVIHANIERGPPTNLWARYKFFNSVKYIIGGHPYSLQDIENGVLRGNKKGVGQFSNPFGKEDPRLKVAFDRAEPLIHFGLVCGAKSCPPIKTYSADSIYEQLQLAAASFMENDESVQVDVKARIAKLSAIFKWYSEDFGKNKKEVLEFIASHMGDGLKRTDLQELIKTNNFKVSYLKYDWSINSKA